MEDGRKYMRDLRYPIIVLGGYEVTCASFLPNYGFDRHTIASNFYKFNFDENDNHLKFEAGKGFQFQVTLEKIEYYNLI